MLIFVTCIFSKYELQIVVFIYNLFVNYYICNKTSIFQMTRTYHIHKKIQKYQQQQQICGVNNIIKLRQIQHILDGIFF